MGLIRNEDQVIVRPYRTTQTCRNLLSNGYGVANMSDDVLAFVQTALYNSVLPNFPAVGIPGAVFQDACSWLELASVYQGGTHEQAEFRFQIVHRGRQRDFIGFCRAKNAVIEAAILATRSALLDRQALIADLNHYLKIVEKTGGQREKQAILLVHDYIRKREEP